jgi:DNA invertase Pin-like site-specific DNA recombinase
MEIRKIREQMAAGRSVFDIPMRVSFTRARLDGQDEQLQPEHQVQYYTELIRSRSAWAYVDGYIDEGVSGTDTKKRDGFLRMIADAGAGRFDFIITKEISRFSRSTLDSIRYTQELLRLGVGILFQNDNINTLAPDSEFRLVVMAGVAQDEVRKLSALLKFGFRQSIKNGRVLGNDTIWGYDKQNGRLTVNEQEAEAVRLIFQLYAGGNLGLRRVSQELAARGYLSRNGTPVSTGTIRHILQNPKYKGWYCGNKTRSVDYRSKKTEFLAEREWVCHPDPKIPALVSEELWARANNLYRTRSEKLRRRAAGFQNRYTYSGKIVCAEHQACYHRQVQKSGRGEKEVWQCKIYRQRGRAGCGAPQLESRELDAILARLFAQAFPEREVIIARVLSLLTQTREGKDEARELARLDRELETIAAKQDRLLELHMAGEIELPELKRRNESFNRQAERLASRREALESGRQNQSAAGADAERVRSWLARTLSFAENVDSELVSSILEQTVVKESGRDRQVRLELFLKDGSRHSADYTKHPFASFVLDNMRYQPEIVLD